MEKDLVLYVGERLNKKGYPYYTFKIEYKDIPYYFRIKIGEIYTISAGGIWNTPSASCRCAF